MVTQSKPEYLAISRERHLRATSKNERSQLIDEAIRAPQAGSPEGTLKRCLELLKKLYRASESFCSDKLKCMIPTLLEQGGSPGTTLSEGSSEDQSGEHRCSPEIFRNLERGRKDPAHPLEARA